MDTTERLPPQDLDMERMLLGSFIVMPETIARAVEAGATENTYYQTAHRHIHRAILRCFDERRGQEIPVIADTLREAGILEAVGDTGYLAELAERTATTTTIEPLVTILNGFATRRRLIAAAAEITRASYEPQEGQDLGEMAQNTVQGAIDDSRPGSVRLVGDLLPAAMAQIEAYAKTGSDKPWLTSGFSDIDAIICGMYPGDLWVLAGRPGMGKSALALQIALHASRCGRTVNVHSLEMSTGQLMERLLSTEARVDLRQIRGGTLPARDYPRLATASSALYPAPLWIDDSPNGTVQQLRAKAKRTRPALIVVDYLQLMTGNAGEGREREISGISRGLKLLAKEENCAVLALSQLSRACEARRPPKPMLSDLRESGAIEQDSDGVIFVYRPSRYDIASDQHGPTDGRADIIIDKQRNGPTGIAHLTFIDRWARFENRSTQEKFDSRDSGRDGTW